MSDYEDRDEDPTETQADHTDRFRRLHPHWSAEECEEYLSGGTQTEDGE